MSNLKYEDAKKRVNELKDFYYHLISFIGVNILLLIIDLLSSPRSFWFYWVTIFWGLAVILHGSQVYIFKGKFLGKEWEEKKIKEIMDKESKAK